MMLKNGVKRVLVKFSGEALSLDHGVESVCANISSTMLTKIATDVKNVRNVGVDVCIVVGGGNIYRGVTGMKEHGIDRATSDYMGMLATVINALALQSTFEKEGISCRVMSAVSMPTIGEPYIRRKALRHMEHGRVVIFAAGTGNPFFTTDTAAALRAAEMGCDLLLKATKVDGVYTSDPEVHADAKHVPSIAYDQVISRDLKVMDTASIALMRENNIPIAVYSIYEENGLHAVLNGQGKFTYIAEQGLKSGDY